MRATKSYVTISCSALLAFGTLIGCGSVAASDPTGITRRALSTNCPPAVPSTLAVPDGNQLAFFFGAIGVQIYQCNAARWVFQAPEANLYNNGDQLAGTHYAGPTWEAVDGSKVVGAKVAAFTPDPTAIPWLLLRAVSHDGDGRMAKVTFIQRLDTTGGLAPSTGCDTTSAGAIARVDYTATYFFYEEKDGNDEPGNCQ
jgi:hypothetical protein